jgi:hypothetical protein
MRYAPGRIQNRCQVSVDPLSISPLFARHKKRIFSMPKVLHPNRQTITSTLIFYINYVLLFLNKYSVGCLLTERALLKTSVARSHNFYGTRKKNIVAVPATAPIPSFSKMSKDRGKYVI